MKTLIRLLLMKNISYFIFIMTLININNTYGISKYSCHIKGFVFSKSDTLPEVINNNHVPSRQKCDSITFFTNKIKQQQTTINSLEAELNKSRIYYDELAVNLKNHFSINGNRAYRVKHNTNSFDCYEVDLYSSKLGFFLKDDKGKSILSLSKLSKLLGKNENIMVFATNAGMYNKDYNPQGLFIEKRTVVTKIDKRTGLYGNFYLQPNGIFFIDSCQNAGIIRTDLYTKELERSLEFATQSGPLLVIDDLINSIFKSDSENLNIRNGVGINVDGKVIFVISNEKVSFYNFAKFFKEKLKCPNALYLDGAISETFLPELGRFQFGGLFGPLIAVYK